MFRTAIRLMVRTRFTAGLVGLILFVTLGVALAFASDGEAWASQASGPARQTIPTVTATAGAQAQTVVPLPTGMTSSESTPPAAAEPSLSSGPAPIGCLALGLAVFLILAALIGRLGLRLWLRRRRKSPPS